MRKRLVKFLSLLNLVYQEPSLVDHTPCILPYINISTRRVKHSEDNRSLHLELFHTLPSVSLLLANFDLYPFPEGKYNSEYIYTWVYIYIYIYIYTHTHTHVMPDVRIPEREERRPPRQCNLQKGKFITDSSQGLCRNQHSGAGSESPEPKLLHKFIR